MIAALLISVIVGSTVSGSLAADKCWSGPVKAKEKIEWVKINGGTFIMGSGESAQGDEKPPHVVVVPEFHMAKTEVTVAQYSACVRAGACKNLDRVQPCADHPVVGVNWEQASAFSKWAGGRLPSEAEWEYAARSRGKRIGFPWGNEPASCERAIIEEDNVGGCGKRSTWPICSRPAGNTDQGLCDMAGNVWEWTQDRYYPNYGGSPADGSAWEIPPTRQVTPPSWGPRPSTVTHSVAFKVSPSRVFRGGSWEFVGSLSNPRYRTHLNARFRLDDLGFRPARSLPSKK